MNHSEFRKVVDRIFGTAYGQALLATLALPEINHRTANQALDDGVPPLTVWKALVKEMNLDDEAEYAHRQEPEKK